jgi:hypothetical protein
MTPGGPVNLDEDERQSKATAGFKGDVKSNKSGVGDGVADDESIVTDAELEEELEEEFEDEEDLEEEFEEEVEMETDADLSEEEEKNALLRGGTGSLANTSA